MTETHGSRVRMIDRWRLEKLRKWYKRHRKVIEASMGLGGEIWLTTERIGYVMQETGARAKVVVEVLAMCEPERGDEQDATTGQDGEETAP